MFQFGCQKDSQHPMILAGVEAIGKTVRCPICDETAAPITPYRAPWYRGNIVSSMLLVLLLFVVVFANAGTVHDATNPTAMPDEISKLAIVAVAMAMFEIGRMTGERNYQGLSTFVIDKKTFGVSTGMARLVVFFGATSLAFWLYSNSIDKDEFRMLMILAAVTGVWEAIATVVKLTRSKNKQRRENQLVETPLTSFFKSVGSGVAVAVVMGAIGGSFSLVGYLFDDTRSHIYNLVIDAGEEVRGFVDRWDKILIHNASDSVALPHDGASAARPTAPTHMDGAERAD